MTLHRFLLVGSMGLTLAACSDYGLNGVEQPVHVPVRAVNVTPSQLSFGPVSSSASVVLPFTVRNVGETQLTVDAIEIDNPSFSIWVDELPIILEVDESFEVPVTFAPSGLDTLEAQVLVFSNDAERPEVPVGIDGRGLVPWLVISPDLHSFGDRDLRCPDTIDITVQNVGMEPLQIDELRLDGDVDFTLSSWTGPLTLQPHDFRSLELTYLPTTDGEVSNALVAISNDPRGEVSASQTGTGLSMGSHADTFEAPVDPPVDILFAIDQSCSMDDDAAFLAAQFGTFIDLVSTQTEGWKIGVTTFDDGCFNHGVLEPGTPKLEALFTNAVTLGEDLDIVYDEALLHMTDEALQRTGAGECNADFLRPGALLHVVVVSDEPERSTEKASAWSWDHWVNRYEGYVSHPSLLKVSGVVDDTGCNEGDRGYAEAIAATGGEHLSICSGSWSSHAKRLAEASLTHIWSFPLSQDAAGETVRVWVDGVEMTEGWSYDEEGNAVAFSTLTGGAQIEVRYGLASDCL